MSVIPDPVDLVTSPSTLEYQVPVWKPGWGALTVNAFVDAGQTRWRAVEPLRAVWPRRTGPESRR
ncbi:MAG TPA: hypothetical protein VLT61_13880 [Anaeromyxobacteraceae bacterium]|nr:hypothetical protein [Anaeromyxobacteraceae bacterium]